MVHYTTFDEVDRLLATLRELAARPGTLSAAPAPRLDDVRPPGPGRGRAPRGPAPTASRGGARPRRRAVAERGRAGRAWSRAAQATSAGRSPRGRRSRSAGSPRSRGVTGSPWPGTTTPSARSSSMPSVAGQSSGKESSKPGGAPCSTRSPAKRTPVSGRADDHVVVGVAAPQVAELHDAAAEVELDRILEGPVGRVERRPAQLHGEVGHPADDVLALGGPVTAQRLGTAGVRPDLARPEGGVAEGVVEVDVGVRDDPGQARQLAEVLDQLAGLDGRGAACRSRGPARAPGSRRSSGPGTGSGG